MPQGLHCSVFDIKFCFYYQLPLALFAGNSQLNGVCIEPHHHEVNEMDNHGFGHILEWQGSNDPSATLFDKMDSLFHFAYLVIGSSSIDK